MKKFLKFIFPCLIIIILPCVSGQSDCNERIPILCQISRLIHRFIDKLNALQAPIIIFPGFEIELANNSNISIKENDFGGDESLIGRIRNYLEFHEIKINLSGLVDLSKFLNIFTSEVKKDQPTIESRKKDGKIQMVALSLIFGKMIAFLKIGSLGVLAMKALGIASMALLLSVMLGLKSLQQSAEDTSHHVQYISDGYHRRRKRYIAPYAYLMDPSHQNTY